MTNQNDFDTINNDQFILVGKLSAEDKFVEGVTQFFFGFPNIKILFHTVINPQNDSSKEIRKASQFLTMPTLKAIELAHLILSVAKQSEEALLGSLNQKGKEQLLEMLKDFNLSNFNENCPTQEIQDLSPVVTTKKRIKKVPA